MLPETRVLAVDLEDRDKDYLLKAEMPGFKKEDNEIEVKEISIEITGTEDWKYDKGEQPYIRKERACESFCRMVDLSEEIKIDDIRANLSNGALEITLPKKAPTQRRKIILKKRIRPLIFLLESIRLITAKSAEQAAFCDICRLQVLGLFPRARHLKKECNLA